MMSGMTVGLLKEMLKKNKVSDDDVIDFYFTNSKESREMEIEGIYKRPFGILMEFEPTKLEESND
jgi:hypothetical protein